MLAPVPNMPIAGDYVSVGSFPYTLTPGAPEDLDEVRGLFRESAKWLGGSKQTDLLGGKTWLVWDDAAATGTITLDIIVTSPAGACLPTAPS